MHSIRGYLQSCAVWSALVWSACGLVHATSPGPSGTLLPPSYRVDTWRPEQGLPQNTIKDILQTRDGYLWLGTQFGVVRFDGVSFKTFDHATAPGVAGDNCMGMVEAVDGSLWVAVAEHLLHYKNQRWVSIPLEYHRSFGRRWGLSSCREGGIWLATDHGLFRYEDDKVTRYTMADGLEDDTVTGVCAAPDSGVVYVATSRMIQRRDPATGRFTTYATLSGPIDNQGWQLYLDRTGNLWTPHLDGLRCWREGLPPLLVAPEDGGALPDVYSISEDKNGVIWITTAGGKIGTVTKGRLEWRADVVPADEQPMCIREDREGNIWVGTNYDGLKRIQVRHMRAFLAQDGLLNDVVQGICESKDGSLWFGGRHGLTRLKEGLVKTYPLPTDLPDSGVRSMFEDRSGRMWVGTRNWGLLFVADGKLEAFPLSSDFASEHPSAIYEDRAGRLWIGTTRGLYLLENGNLKKLTKADGLADDDVRAILEDRRGDLWLATYGGLSRLRDGVFATFGKKDGLSDDLAWLLYEDAEGVLWIGTEHGLSRLKDGRFTALTVACGLHDNVINGLLEDARGNFWIGCNRGIYRVSKRDLNRVADGLQHRVGCVVYGTADGMANTETNGEMQPSACQDRAGRFWFPTAKGAVFFDPQLLEKNELPPPVVIMSLVVDQTPVLPISPLRVAPGQGRVLEFRYTGNSLVAPEKVLYRYRLEGYDRAWIDAGNRRNAYYTNLRPGSYRFQVLACNNHGVWNETGASLALVIEPYFYQTWPFYVFCALAVVACGVGLHRVRVRVLARILRLEQQHALDIERSRIAQDMHDGMGSSLARIGFLSEIVRRELDPRGGAAPPLADIEHIASDLVRSMDEIVWAVNPRHDTLDSLVGYICRYAQKYLGLAGIRCRFDVPLDRLDQHLSSNHRHNLALAVQECVHNSVRHAKAREVWVRVSVTSSRLTITVEDDGCGFNVADVDSSRNGLANMHERLAGLGGQVEIVSSPGAGTKTVFRVPLDPNFTS